MDILLTGATGFLGTRLAERLVSNGFRVIAPVRRVPEMAHQPSSQSSGQVEPLIYWPIPESGTLGLWDEFPNVAGVVHTATQYGRNGIGLKDVLEANLSYPIEIIEAGIKAGVQFAINVDSFYSKTENYVGQLQNYIYSKKSLGFWLQGFSREIPIFNIQVEHMYGPGDHSEKFIPWIVREIAKNQVAELQLSQGFQVRDFIHVSDVAKAITRLVLSQAGKEKYQVDPAGLRSFSIGTGVGTSVRDVASLVKYISGSKTVLLFGETPVNPGELESSVSDKKFQDEFSWESKVSLREGLAELIATQSLRNRFARK